MELVGQLGVRGKLQVSVASTMSRTGERVGLSTYSLVSRISVSMG
ncbi:hypothetical protein [Kribbella sp.]|nr:hypothetical protein [Kribbella sp.]HZX06748.1 hypothetical protein [Kribbella sp.]